MRRSNPPLLGSLAQTGQERYRWHPLPCLVIPVTGVLCGIPDSPPPSMEVSRTWSSPTSRTPRANGNSISSVLARLALVDSVRFHSLPSRTHAPHRHPRAPEAPPLTARRVRASTQARPRRQCLKQPVPKSGTGAIFPAPSQVTPARLAAATLPRSPSSTTPTGASRNA